jgi:hypothetical protein
MRRAIIGPLVLALAACSQVPAEPGYVMGAVNAEDLVPIPGTGWIIASGLDAPGVPGRLTLIDAARKSARLLFSGESPVYADKREGAPDCPGPLQQGKFGAHGIALRPTGAATGTLYVVNHTGREAVELFALDWSGKEPHAAWTGCIPLPAGVLSNGVAPLPDGRIAVTHMNVPEYFGGPTGRENTASWIPKFISGETTGYAATWGAGEGWKKVPGSEGPVPNGIAASADGQWLYVAMWRGRELRKLPLGPGAVQSARFDFYPDNVHWGDDGKLWVAGAVGEAKAYFACAATKGCHNDYAIASVDPASLAVTPLPHKDTRPAFGDGTVAVRHGGEVWIGANPTDKVAYIPLGE